MMAKYRITGVPKLNKLSKGGDPGDNFYNYNGFRYKRNQYGQWFYWNPAFNAWHQAENGTPGYSYTDLEKMHKEKNPALESTTEKKEKDKQAAAAASTKRAAIINSPIISAKEKIDYVISNPTIDNPEILRKLQAQKQQEDAKKAQEDYLKQQEELKRQEEEYLRLSNPNFYNSETTQNVARASGALLTKAEQDKEEERKQDLEVKKTYLGRGYAAENYTALKNEQTNNAVYGIKGVTWDDADKLSTLVLNDVIDSSDRFSLEDDIKAKFPNATKDQIKKYKDYIFDARNKAKTQIFKAVGDWDIGKALKDRGYYNPWTPNRDQIKTWNPNTTEMTGRMPKTAGEWMTRIGDVIANPLDAIHYGMSPTEEMPMNMYEYEKAKQALGYEDGADQNTVLGAVDFASWFTGAGAVAQGMKMLRPTGEAVYNFAQDPSLASGANAALNVGFNALAMTPAARMIGKSSAIVNPSTRYAALINAPGKTQIMYGNPYIQEAEAVVNLPGFKLARGKMQSTLPAVSSSTTVANPFVQGAIGLANQAEQTLLKQVSQPHQVTESPLTTITPVTRERKPVNLDAALKDENIAALSVELTPEVESIFNSNPELAQVGNVSEYVDYLKQLYPNSSAQDILYHVTRANEIAAESGRPFYATQDKSWISELEEFKGKRKPVAMNIENPTVLDPSYEFTDKAASIRSNSFGSNLITPTEAKQPGTDGVIGRDLFQSEGRNTYVSFEPNQVLPLGSKQDVEMFKQWKEGQTVSQAAPSVAETAQTLNKSDNELVSNIINDIRERKIGLWQSPEGQKRLQEMIDNTPSLEGQTPETMIEGIAQMENLNNFYQTEIKLNQDLKNEADQLDIFYNEGKINSNDYFNRVAELESMIKESDKYLDDTEALFKKAGFYSADANVIGIRPGAFKPGEIEKVTSHELGHFLGSFGSKKSGTTYLDEKLSKLELVDETSEQLTIPGLETEGTGAYSLMGPGTGKDYVNKSLNYFLKGSNGTEKVPFVAEVREDMLQKGIIKSEYDNITAKMLKDHYRDYKNTRGEKYPLRIYDIIKDKPENFNIMSDVLNRLPMIAGAALAYDELMNDDDSNVSEAGIGGIGLFLGLLAKKPGAIKIPKKLRGMVRDFQKYGNQAINLLRSTDIRYVKSQIKKLEGEWKQIGDDLGYGINEGLTQQEQRLSFETQLRNNKFKRFFKDRELRAEGVDTENPFANPFQLPKIEEDVIKKKQTLDTYNEAGDSYRITPEGIETTNTSMFEGVTTTGSKPVTDLSTGQVVNAEVKLPGYHEEYKIVNGELNKVDLSNGQVIISPEYVTALKNSRVDVETKIPGAKVFGSSVLVTDAGMPHITGDIDVIITQSDYNKNVKDKFKFVQDYGPAKQHAVYPQHGQEGILDFNIIHEDANGMVIPFYNPRMPDKTPMEIELFRQFYPEKFQEASTKAAVSGKPIEINMSAKDFMKGIDPQVKTVIDSYETSPFNKWGTYNANKEKHILRPDVLIAYGNPEVVAKGQEAYIKSIVGAKGTVGHQFTTKELSDVNKNIDALLKMNFQENVLQTAQNPERMQLALNDYYINHTVFSREISSKGLPDQKYTEDLIHSALTDWVPGKGSFNGIGLNAVQKGNPTHVVSSDNPIIGHRQLGLKLDTSDPSSYIDSLIKGTSGEYMFTPDEMKVLEDLVDKYIPDVKFQIGNTFKSRKILDFQPQDIEKSKEFLDELSEQTGIRAIRKDEPYGTYGAANARYASLLGKFDEVADAMMYSLKEYHASPKTYEERIRALEEKKQRNNNNVSNIQINTVKDFKKLYSILDGGIKTAESRLMQLTDQLSALNSYKENLIEKMATKDDILLGQIQNQIVDLLARQQLISLVEIPKLQQSAKKLKEFYKIMGYGTAGVGLVGTGLIVADEINKKDQKRLEEEKKQLEININRINKAHESKITKETLGLLPNIAAEYLIQNPSKKQWPNGEPIVFITESLVKTPKGLVQGEKGLRWEYSYEKYEDGGEVGLEMELTPEEIQDYLSRGYVIVEE